MLSLSQQYLRRTKDNDITHSIPSQPLECMILLIIRKYKDFELNTRYHHSMMLQCKDSLPYSL